MRATGPTSEDDDMDIEAARTKRAAPIQTRTSLPPETVAEIAGGLNGLLADVFALYVKTKNFHWHTSGRHFRDDHLMFDEQAEQLLAMTDPLAERVRKIGAPTMRSIGQISRLQRVLDNDADYITPFDMLAELRDDNFQLAASLRAAHQVCADAGDVAGTSLIETWIDEAEGRAWFLFETSRRAESDA